MREKMHSDELERDHTPTVVVPQLKSIDDQGKAVLESLAIPGYFDFYIIKEILSVLKDLLS